MPTVTREGERPRATDLLALGALGAGVLLAAVLGAASAALGAGDHGLAPGGPHYLAHFDPSQVPWRAGEVQNIEEVFKHWQYYAVHVEDDGQRLLVQRFQQGVPGPVTVYRVGADGALHREPHAEGR